MARPKKNHKLDMTVPQIAESFANRFIGAYGIKDAEVVAKLTYEKIVASRRSLERKYGS